MQLQNSRLGPARHSCSATALPLLNPLQKEPKHPSCSQSPHATAEGPLQVMASLSQAARGRPLRVQGEEAWQGNMTQFVSFLRSLPAFHKACAAATTVLKVRLAADHFRTVSWAPLLIFVAECIAFKPFPVFSGNTLGVTFP